MQKKRNKTIDSYKGILVVLMVLAHVIQLLGIHETFSSYISTYVNLTTFSGFFFIFGFTNQIAYFNKEDVEKSKNGILNNAFKVLTIYYISAFSYQFFISNDFIFSLMYLAKTLLLFRIPGYSEFLLSFFLLSLVSFMLFDYLKKITIKQTFVVSIISLLITFIPIYKIGFLPHLGLLIGSENFSAFPIIQYLPFYLIGIIFSKYKIIYNFKILIISFTLTILFFIYAMFWGFPSRFPPSLFFLFGSAFFLYFYFLVLNKIYATTNIIANSLYYLEEIGRSTLFYLIFSNITIFSISSKLHDVKLSFIFCVFLTFAILFSSYSLTKIVK